MNPRWCLIVYPLSLQSWRAPISLCIYNILYASISPLRPEQATASLQSRLVLSGLSPDTNYVALVRRAGGAWAGAGEAAATEVRFSTPEVQQQ